MRRRLHVMVRGAVVLVALAGVGIVCWAADSGEEPACATAEAPCGAGEVMIDTAGAELPEQFDGLTLQPVRVADHLNPGEKLVYLAKWTGVPAGVITQRVWPAERKIAGQDVFMFELQIESNDFLSTFYEVNTTIRSFAAVDTGYSYLFRRKVREGDYRADDTVSFDYAHTSVLGEPQPLAEIRVVRDESCQSLPARPIPGPVLDPLSIAYYLRGLKIAEVGDVAEVLVADRYATSLVQLEIVDAESLKLPGIGTFDCLVVRPSARSRDGQHQLLNTQGAARIWVEKTTKVPLFVEAEIPIGKATATLVSYEQVDLDAQIQAPASEEEAPESVTPPPGPNPFRPEHFGLPPLDDSAQEE